jgi:asparagine synthase (glutamine-hydrolysing)
VLRHVRALPAGHFLWIAAERSETPRAFFDLAEMYQRQGCAPKQSAEQAREALRSALRDSVEQHLVADVPVGAFLSAGIDSGAIVGLARDVLGAQATISAVTLAFEELRGSAQDEAPLAATVARHYDARHSVRVVQKSELEQDLPRFFEAMDQPTLDGLNTWFVSKATREQGLKVALSGLGGDELLGGYPSFRDVPRFQQSVARLGPLNRFGPLLRALLAPLAGRLPVSPKALSVLELGATLPGAYLLKRGLFMPWELPAVIDPELARAGLCELGLLEHVGAVLEPDPGLDHARIAVLESSLYMRNQLLRDADWTSMAFSLEVRVPWVDPVLAAHVARSLAHGSSVVHKRALGEAPARPLPRAVLDRPKTGFQTPIDRWLQDSKLLDAWRGRPMLTRKNAHWSRRYAHCVAERYLAR